MTLWFDPQIIPMILLFLTLSGASLKSIVPYILKIRTKTRFGPGGFHLNRVINPCHPAYASFMRTFFTVR